MNATLNGAAWSGVVNYALSGPTTLNGTSVPADFQGKPTGSYTLSYTSGGPSGATLSSISPSSTQTLSGGGVITFTLNFVTMAPTATTGTCQVNGPDSALLFGTVNPNGSTTTAWFQWGTSTTYGNQTPAQDVGPGTSAVQVLHQISSLLPNTTYHFRMVGQNSGGTSYGADLTCTTPPPAVNPPTVTTEPATSVTSSSATLNGTVNPNGASVTGWFEWGTSMAYGTSTPPLSGGSGTSPVPMNVSISGLSPNTTYHFRAVGQNSADTRYGTK